MAYQPQQFVNNAFKSTAMKRGMDEFDLTFHEGRNRFQQQQTFRGRIETRIQDSANKNHALALEANQRSNDQADRTEEQFNFNMLVKEENWDRNEAERELKEKLSGEKLERFDADKGFRDELTAKSQKATLSGLDTKIARDEQSMADFAFSKANREIDEKYKVLLRDNQISEQEAIQASQAEKEEVAGAIRKNTLRRLKLKEEMSGTASELVKRNARLELMAMDEKEIIREVGGAENLEAIRTDISNDDGSLIDFVKGVRDLQKLTGQKRINKAKELTKVFNTGDDTLQGEVTEDGVLNVMGKAFILDDRFLNALEKGALGRAQKQATSLRNKKVVEAQVADRTKLVSNISNGSIPTIAFQYRNSLQASGKLAGYNPPPTGDAAKLAEYYKGKTKDISNMATLDRLEAMSRGEELKDPQYAKDWKNMMALSVKAGKLDANIANRAYREIDAWLNEKVNKKSEYRKNDKALLFDDVGNPRSGKNLKWVDYTTESIPNLIANKLSSIDDVTEGAFGTWNRNKNFAKTISDNFKAQIGKFKPGDKMLFNPGTGRFIKEGASSFSTYWGGVGTNTYSATEQKANYGENYGRESFSVFDDQGNLSEAFLIILDRAKANSGK